MTTAQPKKTKYDPIAPEAALIKDGITSYGHHRIQHASATQGISKLMQDDKADLIYSDPPWGQGNVSYWQTMKVKMNPGAVRQEIDLNHFLNVLMGFYKDYSKQGATILIEYGQGWRQKVINHAKGYGLINGGVVQLLYKSGAKILPLDLLVFGNGVQPHIPHGFFEEIRNTTGYTCLKIAFKYFAVPGGIVLDPCCGMGYTAQAAIDFDMKFRGNEMNQKRLQVTANRLFKATR